MELIDGQVSQGKELVRYEMNDSDKRYSVHFRLESATLWTIQTTVPRFNKQSQGAAEKMMDTQSEQVIQFKINLRFTFSLIV